MHVLVVFVLYLAGASAFHQEEYRVIHERCDLVNYNRSYVKNITFALSLFNRTTRAFNFHAHLLADMGTNVRLIAQAYKFLSNEYRFFPITINYNLCQELDTTTFGFDDVKKYSNVGSCPFKKRWYHIRNYIPDASKWPPHAPTGRYKSEVKFLDDTNFVLELHWYGKIEEIMKWT